MEQPPHSPLDYRRSDPPRGDGGWSTSARFFGGLIAGSIVSGAVWPLWWFSADQIKQGNYGWVLLAMPGIKVVGSIVCFCVPRWRAFGAGLLVSIAVGFLIFFGICAAYLTKI